MSNLILTRRMGETIDIDGPAQITVLGVRGNQVRLGIEAAPEVKILRHELKAREDRERVQQEG